MSVTLKKLQDEVAIPTADELVERAHALIPMLKANAAETEKNRMVSPAIIHEFVQAGFFKMLQPKRWGGWEMDPKVFWRVLMELGRGCSSSCWNMMILGVHQWEFGHMDVRAGDDVWGQDPSIIVASSYGPTGSCEKVAGGYMLSGQWKTSSGCDHAQWTFLGGFRRNDAGEAIDRIALLVPRTEYEILDDWYVFGLAGTGSKSVILKDVFVPEHRTHSIGTYEITDRSNSYLYPFGEIFCGSVSAAITGFATAAVDTFIEQMSTRTISANKNVKISSNPYVRDRLGNAVAKVRNCRSRLLHLLNESAEYVNKRELVPEDLRVEHILDISRVGRDCVEAALSMFPAMGATGCYLNNPMQRILRDLLAAANHMTQNSDDATGFIGAKLLGTELPPTAYGVKRVSAASQAVVKAS